MMDIKEVREYLPHRYPFLLVDRVRELVPGERIEAVKNVTINEPFFNGHFPHEPIMPGVLIVEAMAQAAGILGLVTENRRPADGYIYLLVGTDKVRFKRQVIPGDQLVLSADFVRAKLHLLRFQCQAHVDGQLVASAEVLVAEQKIEA